MSSTTSPTTPRGGNGAAGARRRRRAAQDGRHHYRRGAGRACSRCSSSGCSTSRRISSTFSIGPAASAPSFIPKSRSTTFPGIVEVHRAGSHRRADGADQAVRARHFISRRWPRALEKTADGRWRVTTDAGTVIEARVVVIAAGGGSFTPKKPPIPGIEAYENSRCSMPCARWSASAAKIVAIAGGGDSALDWTLNLQPIAKKLAARPSPRRVPRGAGQRQQDARAGRGGEDGIHMSPASRRCRARAAGSRRSRSTTKERGDYTGRCEVLSAVLRPDHEARAGGEFRHRACTKISIPVDTEKFETNEKSDLRHRRHQHLSRQAEADPVGLPRRRR